MRNVLLIFSGYNQRALIAFMRTLEDNGLEYAIIASSSQDPIFDTVYKKSVYATRGKAELDLDDIIACVNGVRGAIGDARFIIPPSTEALNRYYLENKAYLNKINCIMPIVSRDLYEKLSDKISFSRLCIDSGINVPVEYKNLDDIKLPIVAKPRKYVASNGVIYSPALIRTEKDLGDFKGSHNEADFFYQDMLDGRSLYLLYYVYRDGKVVKFSQENFVQQPYGKSMIAAEASNFHQSKESEKYEKLLKSVNYYGLIMIEVKLGLLGCSMIEANPRFWGPSQLMVDSGVNLFEDFLYDNGLLVNKPLHSKAHRAKYYWGGGAMGMKGIDNLDFHNYSRSTYEQELESWTSVDVYDRDDTREIFERERIG